MPNVLTVDELKTRLAQLARAEPPESKLPGAKCYSPAELPETVDYLCPVDGSRTQYARDGGFVELIWALDAMRKMVQELPGLDASLDERTMCRRCTPAGHDDELFGLLEAGAETGKVALVVRHPGGQVARTPGVTKTDLQVLREFLEGKLAHVGSMDEESPLKDHLPRIHELLGMPDR